jgi:uncharacterized membrane protein (UPF0127 family)
VASGFRCQPAYVGRLQEVRFRQRARGFGAGLSDGGATQTAHDKTVAWGAGLQTGMMFRTNMTENEAMLFVFAQPHRASFWMKNTLIPLSCAYISRDGVILEIHDLKPRDETSVVAESDAVRFVLETKQGWFQRNNVGVGAFVRSETGSLMDTFFEQR